jgi:hypothetical protein
MICLSGSDLFGLPPGARYTEEATEVLGLPPGLPGARFYTQDEVAGLPPGLPGARYYTRAEVTGFEGLGEISTEDVSKLLAAGGGATVAALMIGQKNPLGVNIAWGALTLGLGIMAISGAYDFFKKL